MKKHTLIALALALLLALSMVALVSCGDDEEAYYPTNIDYDGSRITWSKVAEAEYYTVQINGGEEKRANTTLYTYDAKGEEFEVTVTAIVDGDDYSSSLQCIPLDTISEINVSDDGTLSWAEVAGATAYRLSVNGNVLPTDTTLTEYKPEVGSSRVKIRPVVPSEESDGTLYYSSWSVERQIYINTAPSDIKYDGETLTWLGNSKDYELVINGNKTTANDNKFLFDANNADFTVSVKSIGDHESTFDSVPTEETFYYLKPATNLKVEDGILTWDTVENAEGYEIKLNGVVQPMGVTESAYDKIAPGTTVEISIKPYKNEGKFFSVWSEAMSIYLLEAPELKWNSDLELDGQANNNLTWDAINGANGYTVLVVKDGVQIAKETVSATQFFYAHAYAETGKYEVKVRANAEVGSDYYDSKYSTVMTIERLSAPKPATNNYIISDATNLSAGFTVNYTAVGNSAGYQLYKDGLLLDGKFSTTLSITDADVADDSISSAQEYNYYIRSVGKVISQNHVTLSCLTKDALSFKITVQAMPTNLTMSGFNASWGSVGGNNGYAIKYGGTATTVTQTTHDLSVLRAGTYDVSVCTKGNGTTTLASNYTAPVVVTRLTAPTGIKISYGTGEGQLLFDAVENASSYQTFIDLSTQAIPENAYDNMYQYIKESGSVLSMVAVANKYNDLGTVYYMTSENSPTQQFIRLSAPTFSDGTFANSKEVIWNASGNINTAEYTPTYEVWIDNVMQTGGEQNSTKFNIEYLAGGKTYTVKIKAKGNDTKYLDSSFSVDISVYKLNTPKLEILNNQYVWTGVTNASSYVLEIDGNRVENDAHVSGSTYSYTPNYTTKGSHIVKLYAVGDGINTINSSTYTYTQVVDQLLAPEISYSYSEPSFVNGGKIQVSITKASENASKYHYEIAGETIISDQLNASKSIESTGEYYVRAKALGGVFDENDIYYIDSQYAGGGTGYTIKLLAPPTVASFSLNGDGAVKWATISGANGYEYQISYDDGAFGEIKSVGSASLDPTELCPTGKFSDYSTIKIKVRARGTGSSSITSEWVTYTWNNPNK